MKTRKLGLKHGHSFGKCNRRDRYHGFFFFVEPLFLSHQAYPVGNYPYPRNSNFETEGKPFRMKL